MCVPARRGQTVKPGSRPAGQPVKGPIWPVKGPTWPVKRPLAPPPSKTEEGGRTVVGAAVMGTV
eukprot:4558712-Pyramimonas_sp.AAC.1